MSDLDRSVFYTVVECFETLKDCHHTIRRKMGLLSLVTNPDLRLVTALLLDCHPRVCVMTLFLPEHSTRTLDVAERLRSQSVFCTGTTLS